VDYPIIGNPNNHNNVAMLFSRVILASKKHSFKKYRFKKHPNLNIQKYTKIYKNIQRKEKSKKKVNK
jgi:hypothetical protein